MTWTFETIKSSIRDVTGSPSETQITDAYLGELVNNYYQLVMPSELKMQIENNFLDFKTVPGQDVYTFNTGYFTDSPGIYADGFPCIFYEDPDIFYQDWPQQYAVDIIGTGDDSTPTFSGTLQNPPLIISSLFVSDNSTTLQSNSGGTFDAVTGTGSGTINYTTGVYSVTFGTPPASSEQIYAKYIGYTGNRPSGCLFFQNQFTLRPVPDQVYQMHMQGYIVPTALVASPGSPNAPLQAEWGPLIVYGVSLDIFSYRGDMGGYNEIYPIFKRYEAVALSRTIQQLSSQQSVPRF